MSPEGRGKSLMYFVRNGMESSVVLCVVIRVRLAKMVLIRTPMCASGEVRPVSGGEIY